MVPPTTWLIWFHPLHGLYGSTHDMVFFVVPPTTRLAWFHPPHGLHDMACTVPLTTWLIWFHPPHGLYGSSHDMATRLIVSAKFILTL